MPPPQTAAYSSDYSAAAPATAGLGWRVFGRIWQDFGTEQKQPVMDDLLYPDQAVDGVVHAEGMSKLKAALQAQLVPDRTLSLTLSLSLSLSLSLGA